MKTTILACQKLANILTVAIAMSGCTSFSESEPLTWDEFVAQASRDPSSGLYIVNGDETAEDLDDLRSYYDGYLDSFWAAEHDGIGRTQKALIVNRVCATALVLVEMTSGVVRSRTT